MKILVTAKRIPDPEQKIKLKGSEVDLSAANWQLNQFDEYAVETALRLTENASAGNARDGEVVVASIGPKEAAQQLRSALAMGADKAVLVDGTDDKLDAEVVARTMQKLVERDKPDLVIVGKLAADNESNDVGQRLAGYLGWPQATFACSIEVVDGGKALKVGREVDAGVELKQVTLPAVVTVDLRIVAARAVKNGKTAADHAYTEGPRYASLKGIMAAKKKPIEETTLAALGVSATPKVKFLTLDAPPARKAGMKVASVEELVQKLHNEAKVILMGNVLIVLENADGHVRTASLHAVTFGKKMAELHGGKLQLLVLGQGVDAAAGEAAQLGAAEVLVGDDAALAHPLAETWAAAIAQAAKESGASVVAATATAVGKDVMPRVAALLDAGLAADIIGVSAANRFKRSVLYGLVIAEVEVSGPTIAATVRQTEFPAAAPGGAASPIRKLALSGLDAKGATFVSISAQKSDRPELTEAKIVVSGGRGMREGKNFEQIAQLADLLGGAMGASRAACDAGMVPNDLQVGQTGKVVAPNLYIAVAISGAIQHLAGMKGSKVIVAINNYADAPIFQVADYGLVDTWEKTLPALIAEVKKLKEASR